jgi:hypothetical protein
MKAYRIIAKNLRTGIRVERQQIDGKLITNEDEAWMTARAFAQSQFEKTGEQWSAHVESYNTRP